jgi:hypothetical protein
MCIFGRDGKNENFPHKQINSFIDNNNDHVFPFNEKTAFFTLFFLSGSCVFLGEMVKMRTSHTNK